MWTEYFSRRPSYAASKCASFIPSLLSPAATTAFQADLWPRIARFVLLCSLSTSYNCPHRFANCSKMQSLQEEYEGDGLAVVGVANWYAMVKRLSGPALESRDHAAEAIALKNFLTMHKVKFSWLVVARTNEAASCVEAMPTLICVDRTDVARKVVSAGQTTFPPMSFAL